ncbi:hypothetical protein C8R48DRAFT_334255 [Suillus tomentosus]|nr:hypothetical protein C8R48DRAFT_334255 [Suillus tomentosus]
MQPCRRGQISQRIQCVAELQNHLHGSYCKTFTRSQCPLASPQPYHANCNISRIEFIQVDSQPFRFRPIELTSLLDPKNLETLDHRVLC